ncbi:hypothetical protein ACIP9H_25590 [Streptomyces sp. NPDC088732]|uniref:hypothetical protein n=1 Tax=Streptomyces sp. NPDC088732 TaxID=3365879 RepID=UPI003812783B
MMFAEGEVTVANGRTVLENPAYVGLVIVGWVWTAASSGSSVYLRVPAAVFAVFWTALLIGHLIKLRRKRASGPAGSALPDERRNGQA